jgi:hypothetical protein
MLGDIERRELALHRRRQAPSAEPGRSARALKVKQPAIAQLEQRANIHVGHLRRYVEVLGGTLDITARFPDGEVTITNFRDVGPETDRPGGETVAQWCPGTSRRETGPRRPQARTGAGPA